MLSGLNWQEWRGFTSKNGYFTCPVWLLQEILHCPRRATNEEEWNSKSWCRPPSVLWQVAFSCVKGIQHDERIKESDQVTHTITWLKFNKNLMSSRRIALHRFWPAPSHQLGTGTLWRYWSTTRGSGTRENEERTSQHDLQKYQISSNGNSNIKYARETWQ